MPSKTTRFERLLEAVPDALVGMDQKGVITFVNRQTESLFGYDRQELIGQPIETLVPEPLWQIYATHREDYFADPRTRSSGLELVLSGRHRDGNDFPANITLSHIDTGDVLLVITAVRDVAKQRLAVKNAELIAAIVEYSDDAIIGATLEGIITSWNPAAERLYGYSSREIIGQSASLLTPDDRAGEFPANLARLRQGQAVEHFETVRVRKDGSRVPVSLTVAPIRDEDGTIAGLSVVHRDVTEQRQALEVAQRLAAIVESSEDAIFSSTLEGIITSWNPAAERLFGYSSQEMIGESGRLLTPGDRTGEVRNILARVGAGQHIEHRETIRVRKDGTVFPVSLTVSPVRDRDGAVIGASAISRDMTELKHAERYARSLIEAGLDPLMTISPEGQISDVNEATVKVTGIPRERLIGTDFSHYFTDPDKAKEGYQQVFTQGSVTDFPLTLRHQDGTLTDVLYNASLYRDFNERVLGVFAAARDVTEQRRAFEVAQRMEAIIESSDDAIIGRTLDGIITSWNPAAERMFGYASEEIIDKSAEVLIPDDRIGEAKADVAAVSAGRHIEQIDTMLIRKDGTVFPVLLTVSPIRNADGTVIGVSVIARDMTEREHAAQYARSLLKAAMDPLVTISPEGKIDDVNEATAKVTGIPRDRLIGTDFSRYFTDPVKAHEGYAQAFQQGSVTDYPLTLSHRDGTLTDVLYNASVYRDTTGKVLGVFAAARDVTRQKEAAATAQRITAIVESSDDAIVGRTLDGTITSWNPAAERIFGYSSKEIVGQPIDVLSPADRTGETISILASISAGRAVENFETIRIRKDGTAITVTLTISPIRDENGAVVGSSMICRDVTELKHAAQYTRSLIEAALDPLVTISPEGKINDVNNATVAVTGVPRKKLIGTDFSNYFTDPDQAHEGYRQAFEQGSVSDYPLTLRHRDGTLTDVLYNASVYRDTTGHVLGVFAAARDMTRQKEAFEAAQRLAAIVEYSDDAIVGSTLDGIITSWNPAAERLYGYPSEKILRRSVDLLSPEDRAGEISSTLTRIKSGQHVDNFETVCVRRDRSTFPARLTIAPIHDANGAVVGASAIAHDVTEQRQALESARHLAAIVEGSDDAIFSRTLDGTVTSWNPAAERLYGYSSEEIIGRSIDLTIPRDRAGEAKAVVAKVGAGQHVGHLETIRARKDGTLFPVSITVSPIRDAEGTVVGASAIAREMTEQERAGRRAGRWALKWRP